MMKKFLLTNILFLTLTTLHAEIVPILPGPIVLVATNSYQECPTVCYNGSQYMSFNNQVDGYQEPAISTDGSSWTLTTSEHEPCYTIVWVAGTEEAFVASYIAYTTGFSTAAPTAMNSTDSGDNWDITILKPVLSVLPVVVVSGVGEDFIVTWCDSSGNNPWWSISIDAGGTWSSAATIATPGDLTSPVINYGTSSGFLASWHNGSNNVYTSFISSPFSSWSSPVAVTNATNAVSDVWCTGYDSNFMLTWVDSLNQAWGSFSLDNGSTWSDTPFMIATDLFNPSNIAVSCSSFGFVVSWIGSDSNAYASLSTDSGATWSTPKAITNTGDVFTDTEGLETSFVDVVVVDDTAMFVWTGGGLAQEWYSCLAQLNQNVQPRGSGPPRYTPPFRHRRDKNFKWLPKINNHR